MSREKELSDYDCKIIASKIKRDIFEPARTYKTSIFLCGKDINDRTSIRFRIAESLTKGFWYSGAFDIIYPEDVFEELLYSSKSTDLLSLENLLADSVDVVVVILESSGSFAELGAFANNEKLRTKMVCVINPKYKKDKSFINQGPIKLLRSANRDAIVYLDENKLININYERTDAFSVLTVDPQISKLASAVRKIRKNNIAVDKLTLLQVDRFLLPAIFLLEPVEKNILVTLVSIVMNDLKNSQNATSTALSMLTKKKFIELTAHGYRLTVLGKSEFFSFRHNNSRNKQHDKTIAIDNLRLDILNLKYRNKNLKDWGSL